MDRRLGRPLPHQQANPTRAPPRAHRCFPSQGVCGISRRFQRLSPTPGQIPTRYSPVRQSPPPERGFPCDLHVLGLPPAFVLSQDQTLRLNTSPVVDLNQRPAIQGLLTHLKASHISNIPQDPQPSPSTQPKPGPDQKPENPGKRSRDTTDKQGPVPRTRPPPAHPFLNTYNVKQRDSTGGANPVPCCGRGFYAPHRGLSNALSQ